MAEEGERAAWPQMALEPERKGELTAPDVLFFLRLPPPPLPVCALSTVEFSPQNLALLPKGLFPHLSINYRFVHERRTDDFHYLLGWVHVCMCVFEKPPAVHS